MIDNNLYIGHIAGFAYYDGMDVLKKLKVGKYLTLQAEPDNCYDHEAVAVYYKKTKLGYLPTDSNKLFSQFLLTGYADIFEVRINKVALDQHPEHQIGIRIRLRKNETKKSPEGLEAVIDNESDAHPSLYTE